MGRPSGNLVCVVAASSSPPFTSPSHPPTPPTHRARTRFPGRAYDLDSDDEDEDQDRLVGEEEEEGRNEASSSGFWSGWWKGTGREFSLFDSTESDHDDRPNFSSGRPSSARNRSSIYWPPDEPPTASARPASSRDNPPPGRSYGGAGGSSTFWGGGRTYGSYSSSSYYRPGRAPAGGATRFFQPVSHWWSQHISPHVKNWPKIICRVEPTTTLKIRKTLRPLGTIVRLGADFNTQQGVWQFKSSWEDAMIGGKLTLAGRELQFAKSWQLSVGPMEDLVTRLRFRAAVNLQTWKAYARVGFRTERLSPINVMEGFTVWKQVPLDGPSGHVKLEVKAHVALPEPEIEYSTETQRSLIGMGDISVNVEELNLVLDY